MFKQSFLPIEHKEIQILILGSLPGDKSIHEQQYYAHPQNRFWKLMQHIFNKTAPLSYPQKLDLLLENQIGLWDVCARAKRKGSMDLDIVEEIPNDLPHFISQHPRLKTIIFNGQKAHHVYEKHFTKSEHYQYYTLPSTSPANARYSLEKLLQEWSLLLKKD
ncbi:DNA-deoxyinosine glycosylase [Sphingobacterium faecium]|jgi:hypoxanthine-DNA glycosylase|uniref:DNA-deoxyinosine glycosylase n=1 Tax=Sphingobacterium faecium TaxID=34087 RepID=UPI0004E5F90B|nr:DNA-deoxyinosine glycosylase [Sphingobacterium faecium]UXD71678.1 DNA-deoxyinosine glycosylase [Sphingobacterium faecium]WGQ15336.1 DNA-deoxyinosine glycosylase [Sphingobacterium faecium]CDT23845.1 G/U mismatch-specific DNA glycosylase [Sphingobacterium sp. PM2-P1-29]SJN52441.1 G:T/U mismatch-specific uracil/thymine DNA-glycosylase [Sphingobacterium faecium PCAi_F2.5]